MSRKLALIAALGVTVAFAGAASAHITLESSKATVGGAYKAVFRVPHGCDGSPTIRIRVQIPEGVIEAKPQPKAGWQLETVRGRYAAAYDYYGTKVEAGVKEIVWSGGKLPDEFYDEFVIRAYLTPGLTAGSTLYFPVVQECEQGIERWIEIPATGKGADDYEKPAPGVRLEPRAGDD